MYILMEIVSVSVAAAAAAVLIASIRRRKRLNLEVYNIINQNQYEYVIVDSRNQNDYLKAHIPGAVNIPEKQIKNNLPTENMFEKIYVYGYSYLSSGRAADELSRCGYFNVVSFGSFKKWKGPVESRAERENKAEQ